MKLENLLKKNDFEKKNNIFQRETFTGASWDIIEHAESKILIPSDFSYVEERVYIDDLLSILSVNKLVKGGISEKNNVLDFFKGHKIISSGLDDDYFYVKTKSDPSYEGLNIAYTKVCDAISIILEALCENIKTLTEAIEATKSNKLWCNLSFEQEHLTKLIGGYIGLISYDEPNCCKTHYDQSKYERLPESYRDLKIGKYLFLAENGVYVKNNILRVIRVLDFHQGVNRTKPSDSIEMWLDTYEKGNGKRMSIDLEFIKPKRIRIEYLKDLEKVKQVVVSERVPSSDKRQESKYDVTIKVGFNKISIESSGKSFYMECEKPVCENCGKPQWKFGWPDPCDELMDQVHQHWREKNKVKDDVTWHVGMSAGGIQGVQTFFLREKKYCSKGCLETAYTDLVRDLPFAHQPKAEEKVSKLLKKLQLGETGAKWYPNPRSDEDFWEIYLEKNFERNRRKITRYLGKLEVDFKTGKITKKLHPKKVREFIYQKEG